MSKRVSATERASEVSRAEQAQQASGASERAKGRASGPVLTSGFLIDLAHCEVEVLAVRRNEVSVRKNRSLSIVFIESLA